MLSNLLGAVALIGVILITAWYFLPGQEAATEEMPLLADVARGPFIFSAVNVFPEQVQELMKNPRGLIVDFANYDISDENGRNFAFTSRDVLDRTAGITFDLGDGRVESYRVATATDKHSVGRLW